MYYLLQNHRNEIIGRPPIQFFSVGWQNGDVRIFTNGVHAALMGFSYLSTCYLFTYFSPKLFLFISPNVRIGFFIIYLCIFFILHLCCFDVLSVSRSSSCGAIGSLASPNSSLYATASELHRSSPGPTGRPPTGRSYPAAPVEGAAAAGDPQPSYSPEGNTSLPHSYSSPAVNSQLSLPAAAGHSSAPSHTSSHLENSSPAMPSIRQPLVSSLGKNCQLLM